MLGNLLVIVSVLRTKTLRRQKAYYFVVSLALAGRKYWDVSSFSFWISYKFPTLWRPLGFWCRFQKMNELQINSLHTFMAAGIFYIIISLIKSCSDLSVSVGAMVFNAINVLLDGHWLFSVWLCDMYNAMDVVFSTASILNLFCISMYRCGTEIMEVFTPVTEISTHPKLTSLNCQFHVSIRKWKWNYSAIHTMSSWNGEILLPHLIPSQLVKYPENVQSYWHKSFYST